MSDVEATSLKPEEHIASMRADLRYLRGFIDSCSSEVFELKDRRRLHKVCDIAERELESIRPFETAGFSFKMARVVACAFVVRECVDANKQIEGLENLIVRLQAAIDPTCEIPHDADTIAVLRGLVERMEKR